MGKAGGDGPDVHFLFSNVRTNWAYLLLSPPPPGTANPTPTYAHQYYFPFQEPSLSCMETPFLRGYVDTSENLVCTLRHSCGGRASSSATLCPIASAASAAAGRKARTRVGLVGLPSDKEAWCQVGAQTR